MLKVNYFAVLLLIVVIWLIAFLLKYFHRFFTNHSIEINEVSLGIGNGNSVKLVYNKKEKEIAYKLWVELSTRKIGLLFEEENDVITEVYDSWYEFFKVARQLMKEIPVNNKKDVIRLTELTERILNEGLRPHLTKYQARFRKWYEKAIEKDDRAPQEIQKGFELYSELIDDLKTTNNKMIEYKKVLLEIAKGKSEN